MASSPHKIVPALSLPLAVLVAAASLIGLLDTGMYAQETPNWTAQAIGQDMVNLFLIAPFLLVTAVLVHRKNKGALLLWSGAVFYLVYTYVIYCFAVHFNSLFVVYCLILGLSFYAGLYFLLSQSREPVAIRPGSSAPVRTIGVYLIVVAGLFYLLWLTEIIPAIAARLVPQNVLDTGLPVNPVHALDLSVCLPGLGIIGFLLLRRKPFGLLLAPAALVFCILMDITIGGLVVVMNMRGIESDYSLTIIMSVLAALSTVLLVLYLKAVRWEEEAAIPISI